MQADRQGDKKTGRQADRHTDRLKHLLVVIIPDPDRSVKGTCSYEGFPSTNVQSSDLIVMEGLGEGLEQRVLSLGNLCPS